MKNAGKKLLFVFLLTGFVLGLGNSHLNAQGPQDLPRKIIVFKNNYVNEAAQITLLRDHGATVIKPLRLINAVAVYLPEQAERALLTKYEVLRIDDDLVINAIGKPTATAQPAAVLPWGVDRIEADIAWKTTKGVAKKVAILDTGIDLAHPDLKTNIKGQVNTINPLRTANDDNGHGTHVAGIVAAIDNTIGVIGVGPEIYLYAVKALNKNGMGWLSDIIEGLDWCIKNEMEVVNMSLGSSSGNQSFHDAIIATYNAGIVQVAAAGNDGGPVLYPAAYDEVIAVAASDKYNQIPNWSNNGPQIDLTAPGVSIYSTYKGSTYKTLSGTSMATPHVSGTAGLVLTTLVGSSDLDGDGKWDPVEVQNKLKATAQSLYYLPERQGAGLVRADLAVQ